MSIDNNKFISNSEYSNFIALSRYARWLPSKQRRETWEETARRYSDYWKNKGLITNEEAELIYSNIYSLSVMPSMRALMTAGEALDRSNIAGFNCSYTAVNRVEAFDEILYILMNGTGVGFSCERQEVNKLPTIPEEIVKSPNVIYVEDSKEGWSYAFHDLIVALYNGREPSWDVSGVRPSGAPLKVFGGRASGPAPLVGLFKYTVELFKSAKGRKLSSIEVHGLVCKTAEIVVVGGVRRAALISLSNLSDQRMAHAKSGAWWETNPEFALANNSVAYTEKPDGETFMREWLALVESKSGERGVFNRQAAQKHASLSGRRDPNHTFGTNPCAEISLRDGQFCNLSEVVIRSEDTFKSLAEKVRVASIIGTLQATLTDFKYLGDHWRKNTEEEALLGVSLTGIMDCDLTNTDSDQLAEVLYKLKKIAIDTNVEWAARLNIKPSTAVTTVKPSGTVSQLVDSASGIHPRYSEYYIRTVRADVNDPLAKMMSAAGFPVEPDAMKPERGLVFSFPMKAASNAVFRNDRTAIQQLELWLAYKQHWAEHSVSITVYVHDAEWLEVGAWVYKHFDAITGVSFLPHSEHTYQQAPYQEITKEEYEAALLAMPKNVDWSALGKWETEDRTKSAQTMACTGGVCELVDLN
jgi:ribonucleoside-diphosphate reductase alpha chain